MNSGSEVSVHSPITRTEVPHDIEQRLARWLLMAQDRVDSGSLPITHDLLATMLGTNRSSVTLAAGILQRKKVTEYTRGAVTIVNRKRLEDSSCVATALCANIMAA
jgi:CRP-like cAMP-binding protein